jgi:hypothetical protein
VERYVGPGWVRLDNSEQDWLAAPRTGLTDLEQHGVSFRPTPRDEQGTLKRVPVNLKRGAERFAMASQSLR